MLAAVVKPMAEKELPVSEIDFVVAVPDVDASRNELERAVPLQLALLVGPFVDVSM
jgi:hypothetical protein